MKSPILHRVTQYDFVITILWIGFILAISFMETPLRFQADTITLPIALQVGKLVFHALNGCEIVFAIAIAGCHLANRASRGTNRLWLAAFVILAFQTLILFGWLDARTSAIIAGETVAESPLHTAYVLFEGIKVLILVLLARCQISDFKIRLRTDHT